MTRTNEVRIAETGELRFDVLKMCDDSYRTLVAARASEELDVAANDVTISVDGDELVFTAPSEEMAEALPIAVMNSDFWESDAFDSTRLLAQILHDSGLQLGEIEDFLGFDSYEPVEYTILEDEQ